MSDSTTRATDPNGDQDRIPTTAAPVTWEMVYRFQAADDAQAERLAHAWAGTIEAEFGATLVSLRSDWPCTNAEHHGLCGDDHVHADHVVTGIHKDPATGGSRD